MASEPHSVRSDTPFSEEMLGKGKLRLRLQVAQALECGRLCELVVEAEGRAQDTLLQQRGRVKTAVVEIEEAQLDRVLRSELASLVSLLPSTLPKPDELAARFVMQDEKPVCVLLARFPSVASAPLWCSLRLPLFPGRRDLRGPRRSSEALGLSLSLWDADVRVYGRPLQPCSLLGLSATICLSAAFLGFRHASTVPVFLPSVEFAPEPGLRLLCAHGLREVFADVLCDALFQVMPCHGYRAADPQSAALAAVEVENGLLRLTFEGLSLSFDYDDDPRGRSTVDGGQIESVLLADRLLVEGDVPAALAAYEIVSRVRAFAELSDLRRAYILATVPAKTPQALEILDRLLPNRSFDVGGQLLSFALRDPIDRTEAALCELARQDTHTVEERALLLLWAAQRAFDGGRAVELATQALGCVQEADCSTLNRLTEAASELVQTYTTRLQFSASRFPPAQEPDGPLGEFALGERSFWSGDYAVAQGHYVSALRLKHTTAAERAQIHMRLAEIAHHAGELEQEEEELALSIEAGGGAAAWAALSALFQSQGETARLGIALYAWSLHEVGETRADLLRQAARHASPVLLGAIDEALLQIGADDETVRERLLRRRKKQEDTSGLLGLLFRDMHQSGKPRRWASARLCAELAARLGDKETHAEAVLHALSSPWPSPTEPGAADEDGLRAVFLLASPDRATVSPETQAKLRSALSARGSLREVFRTLENRLALLSAANPSSAALIPLLRQTALCLAYLDEPAAAIVRFLRAAALGDKCDEKELRATVGKLHAAGQHKLGRRLVERELRTCPSDRSAYHRLVLGELLVLQNDAAQAEGQLELALVADPKLCSGHALLGPLLCRHGDPTERPRALQHLLTAAHATAGFLSGEESAECALLAAKLLLSEGGTEGGTWDGTERRTDKGADEGFGAPVPYRNAQLSKETARQVEGLLNGAMQRRPGDSRPAQLLVRLRIAQNQPKEAAAWCDKWSSLAQTDAERAQALWQKSECVSGDKQQDELLKAALSLCAEHLPSLSSLRKKAEARGDNAAALVWLERELQASPSDGERAALLCKQADLLNPHTQADLVTQTLRKAMALGSGTAAQRLADHLFARGELLSAADVAGRAAELLPRHEQGGQLLRAAEWALQVGDDLRAREYLRRTTGLPGECADEARERLLVLDGGGEPANRRQTLEDRLKQTRSSLSQIETLRQLVVLCARQNDTAALDMHARSLLSLSPLDELGVLALADCEIKKGGTPERLLSALRPNREYPRLAHVLAAKAAFLQRRGDVATAEALLQEALSACRQTSLRPKLAQQLAALKRDRGDAVGAATTLSACVGDVPDARERAAWRSEIARLWVSADQPAAALLELRTLLSETPKDLVALEQLLSVAERYDEVGEARRCLDELVAAHRGETRARWLCHRARFHIHHGALAEALSDSEAALSLTSDPDLLRSLIPLSVQVSDGELVLQVVRRLQVVKQPLGVLQPLAACALLLFANFPETEAEQLLFFADDPKPEPKPTSTQKKDGSAADKNAPRAVLLHNPAALLSVLCEAVSGFRGPLSDVDRVLLPTRRRLGARFQAFRAALSERAFAQPVDLGAVKLLARLSEGEQPLLCALYLSVLAFVEPGGDAARRLETLSKVRFSPSEERLPQPSDEIRPLFTFLRHFAPLVYKAASLPPSAELDPIARVRQREALLFARFGGELASDVPTVSALVGAAAALWLPGCEAKGPVEQAFLQKLQARALRSNQATLTTDQARLLLAPIQHGLQQEPQRLARGFAEAKDLLHRWARLMAAVEEKDVLAALLSVGSPSGDTHTPSSPKSAASPHPAEQSRTRLALLGTLPLSVFLTDAQVLFG